MVNNTRVMTFLYLPTLVFVLLTGSVSAATITVTTDRQDVGLNESFVMTFESDGSVDDDPDFSPLERDFQILSRSTSSNMSIINGRISSTKKWQLTVLARRAGKLIIPSISFGKDRSQASFVNVKSGRGSPSSSTASRDVFIEVEVDNTSPYVQAEVLYSVRLFLAVATSNASLSEPGISNAGAVIERLNEDTNYQTTRKGKRYNVVERRYAIYPQASGKLTIEGVVFQGQTNRSAFSLFDPFGPQPKTMVERSKSIDLEVRPVPDSFPGNHWLPAKKLTITESWSQNPPVFEVGEPLTRTITVSAEGQTSSQLPELAEWVPANFKNYPDQPLLDDIKKNTGITATRQEKMAIIPNRAGDFVLPEVSVPWWNVTSGQVEYARIPERLVSVTQASTGPGLLPGPAALPQPVAEAEDESRPDRVSEEPQTGTTQHRFWQYLSAGLALAWLLTLVMWWRARRVPVPDSGDTEKQLKYRTVSRKLEKACQEGNAKTAKQALLDWAKLNWVDDPPLSLGEIARRSSSELAEEIDELNRTLYSGQASDWNGARCWEAFSRVSSERGKEAPVKQGNLQPLYRIR